VVLSLAHADEDRILSSSGGSGRPEAVSLQIKVCASKRE
jgi:hypothetical protein